MSLLDEQTKQKLIEDFKTSLNQTYTRYTVTILDRVLVIVDAICAAPVKRGMQAPKEVQIRQALAELLNQYVQEAMGNDIQFKGNKMLVVGTDGTVLVEYELKSMEVPRGY